MDLKDCRQHEDSPKKEVRYLFSKGKYIFDVRRMTLWYNIIHVAKRLASENKKYYEVIKNMWIGNY